MICFLHVTPIAYATVTNKQGKWIALCCFFVAVVEKNTCTSYWIPPFPLDRPPPPPPPPPPTHTHPGHASHSWPSYVYIYIYNYSYMKHIPTNFAKLLQSVQLYLYLTLQLITWNPLFNSIRMVVVLTMKCFPLVCRSGYEMIQKENFQENGHFNINRDNLIQNSDITCSIRNDSCAPYNVNLA